MKLHIVITHYNRVEMLRNLVTQLQRVDRPFTLEVYDDGTPDMPTDFPEWVTLHRVAHHGKQLYYKLWNRIFQNVPDVDACLFLPDDSIPRDKNALSECLTIWSHVNNTSVPTALNLFCLKERFGRQNWKSRPTTIEYVPIRVLNTDWWDGCGFLNREAIAALRSHPLRVSRLRWDFNPLLGSGIGQEITYTLRRQHGRMYQVTEDLFCHLGEDSQMNPDARNQHQYSNWNVPLIEAGMATIPGRENQCEAACQSIEPYVDRLHVVRNYGKVQDLAHVGGKRYEGYADNSLGDGEKFRFTDGLDANADSYVFTIDDDIIYPADYVPRLIHAIERYGRTAAVGVHGKLYAKQIAKFYRGHDRCDHTCCPTSQDQEVNCLGTGTLAYHNSTLDFGITDIQLPNMADIWFAIECQKQNVKQMTVKRNRDWLKLQDMPDRDVSIFDRNVHKCSVQRDIWNRFHASIDG